MATLKSKHAEGTIPMPIPLDQAVVAERMEIAIAAALAVGDILFLGYLPEDTVPADLVVDTDAMGGTCAGSVGLLNDAHDDLSGAAWTTGAALAAAGAVRADSAGLRAMARLAPSDTLRPFGLKVTVLGTATSGTIGVTLHYRSA